MQDQPLPALHYRVADAVEVSRPVLGSTALEEVDHYLRHDEPEMAFEGLLIELTRRDEVPPCFDRVDWACLGRQCGVIEAGVFEPDIWCRFEAWSRRHQPAHV